MDIAYNSEKIWGTSLDRGPAKTSTVSVFGIPEAENTLTARAAISPRAPVEAITARSRASPPNPLTEQPKLSPLPAIRSPYPLTSIPKCLRQNPKFTS